MKKSQLPSDCGNYPDGFQEPDTEKFESLGMVIDSQEKADQFMYALNALNPKKSRLLYGFCSYTNSTIMLDQNYNYITDIHENDGDWREEYFSPIMKHFGVETEHINFDKLLEDVEELLEDCGIEVSKIDYKELFAKKFSTEADKLLKKKIKK